MAKTIQNFFNQNKYTTEITLEIIIIHSPYIAAGVLVVGAIGLGIHECFFSNEYVEDGLPH